MLWNTIESRRNGGVAKRGAGWMFGALALLLGAAVGCGPEGEALEAAPGPQHQTQALIMDNGLSLNGLSLNGLSLNGLSLNGLSLNGLATSSFSTWFQADPTQRDEVMQYLVACAVPAGQTRSYTEPGTSTVHTWSGQLGLAPSWAGGATATLVEQQVVSACMAAHTNKFGIHVTLSLRGLDGTGTPISTTAQELSDYTVREACFFGNLFDGSTGVFGANDGLSLASTQSSPRVCGLPGASGGSQCSPMVYAGSCSTYCTADATGSYYTSCTYGGVTYRPVSTRMAPAELATCGDGVCQDTESCGTGSTPTSCAADCGACP